MRGVRTPLVPCASLEPDGRFTARSPYLAQIRQIAGPQLPCCVWLGGRISPVADGHRVETNGEHCYTHTH